MLAYSSGTYADEAAMHERFNSARVWGQDLGREHFWPSEQLIKHVNSLRAGFGAQPIGVQLTVLP